MTVASHVANISWVHHDTMGYVMLNDDHRVHVQSEERKTKDGVMVPVFT